MGWPMRWLRGLLSDGGRRKPEGDRNARAGRDKKGWGFARSFRDKDRGGGGLAVAGRTGVEEKNGTVAARSFRGSTAVGDGDDQQNKRAIAVAAATAAAAEAAVAAAQAAAAAAIVRLRSKGGGAVFRQSTEDWAAVKIQAAFRGYLARRALRALKGLVKLQALVRGHIVRKQAVETLRCMQALMRAQGRARAFREIKNIHPPNKGSRHHQPIPLTTVNHESKVRSKGAKAVRSASVGGSGTRARRMDSFDANFLQSSGCNWLDSWMEERYWDSQETPSRTCTANDDERNEKILEVDAGRLRLNAKRRNNQNEIYSSCTSYQNSHGYMTMPDSPSKDSTIAQYSVPSPSSVCIQQSSLARFPYEDDICESPQFFSASSRTGSSMKGPHTLLKSECSQSYFNGFSDYPNYMSNTESSRAKLRSHSAPRQRPEFEKSSSVNRALAIGHRDDDLSSTASQRSSLHQKFTRKTYPGSGRLDKMGMPIRTL